jgi:hypothetical protein
MWFYKNKTKSHAANGHYKQWVEASIVGYGKTKCSWITGPLTEVLLIVNLAIRGHDIQRKWVAKLNIQIALYNYYGIMKT